MFSSPEVFVNVGTGSSENFPGMIAYQLSLNHSGVIVMLVLSERETQLQVEHTETASSLAHLHPPIHQLSFSAWLLHRSLMSLRSPQRTEIKVIISELGRQAVELQQHRILLIRLIQTDPTYLDESFGCSPRQNVYHTPLGYLDSRRREYRFSDAVLNLIHKVQLIEASLRRIEEKTTELGALIAPVQCLPVEILAMIFHVGCKMPLKESGKRSPGGALPFPMLIASVSRRWRDIALTTPILWTNLHICMSRPLHWPRLSLERSLGRLLDVTIDCRADHNPSVAVVVSYMAMLVPQSDRWRRFTLITHHSDAVVIVSECLAELHSRSLQYLRISLTGSGPAGNSEIALPPIFKGGAPLLSSVRFDSVALPWKAAPLIELETLDIRWMWNRTKLFYPQFRDLLAASPSLTKLILRGKHVELRPTRIYEPILVPTLRYLELSGDNVCRMSSILVTPALETLTLANVDESEFREFVAWLPTAGARYPALQSLILLNVETYAFSSITELTIINSGADRFLELLRIKQPGSDSCGPISPRAHTPTWPLIKTMTLVDDASYDKLYEIVSERAKLRLPLKRLILHAAYTHNQHWWMPLMQYVKIDGVTLVDREP
ncbi:hypothetical protein B0H21DRAFT_712293 [Amylocystis lapponica]|nr:hypothetical protein B0H21DRAFT_712293 [Amylocystis lapponica]